MTAYCGCCSCEHSQQEHPYSQWCGGMVRHYGACAEHPRARPRFTVHVPITFRPISH